jgi:hypothetical protein
MSIIVPPFVAYQAPLLPIAGKWNHKPPEGDKFIACEINWGLTVPIGQAVQFSLNAGPVEFSQIVAVYVDNGRNGSDIDFLFPDTGKQLTVPGYCQGLFPIITNSLTFYVVASSAGVGDVTVFEILNSMPPPVAILPSQEQSSSTFTGLGVVPPATTLLVPGTGTLQGFTLTIVVNQGATAGSSNFYLIDGSTPQRTLWFGAVEGAANQVGTVPITVTGLKARFINGLFIQTATASGPGLQAAVGVTVFYSVP